MTSAFVSYSWDGDEHRAWVLALATRLRDDGVETVLDQWQLVPGDQLPAFMEKAVRESDYVLIVCTPRYKHRSDRRVGGVGYEGDIITGEVLTTGHERKFIPVLRAGDWDRAAPTWLAGKYYIDLRSEPYKDTQYQDLLTTLLGTRAKAPPVRRASGHSVQSVVLRSAANTQAPAGSAEAFEPIRIVGVIIDEIGSPRNDGTRGSSLYEVPFRFSRRPPPEWAQLFVQAWDLPSRYTSMHRPGIASVHGDTVVLNGTTVEEIERYHRATLILAADEASKKYAEWRLRCRAEEDRDRARLDAHKQSVEDVVKRLKF